MQDIDLQTFIYQIKRELLAPNAAHRAKDPHPIFFIDRIDLEIAVKVQKSQKGEVSFSVLSGGISAGGSKSHEQGHVVKVSLSPIIPKEKLTANLLQDPVVADRIHKELEKAVFRNDSGMAGNSE